MRRPEARDGHRARDEHVGPREWRAIAKSVPCPASLDALPFAAHVPRAVLARVVVPLLLSLPAALNRRQLLFSSTQTLAPFLHHGKRGW